MPDAARLAATLADPPLRVDAVDLCGLWRIDWLRFVCRRPELLEDYPELPVRIRGAFGRRLAEQQISPASRARASAYEALFSTFRMKDGREIPKPTVIRADLSAEFVTVDLGLIGAASAWLDEAAEAMQAALEGGVNLRAEGRVRVKFDVVDIGWLRAAEVAPLTTVSSAAFAFRTPVVTRAGGALLADPRSILRSCIRRAAALAPWQSATLADGKDDAAHAVDLCETDDRSLIPYRFERHSRRRGDEAIPVSGFIGRLVARGPLTPLAPYFAIADRVNIGSHASLGLGAADIALTP